MAYGVMTNTAGNIEVHWSSTQNVYSNSTSITFDFYFICPYDGHYSGSEYGSEIRLKYRCYASVSSTHYTDTFVVPAFNGKKGEAKKLGSLTLPSMPHDPITGEFSSVGYVGQLSADQLESTLIYYRASISATKELLDTLFAHSITKDGMGIEAISRLTTVKAPASGYIAGYIDLEITRFNSSFAHNIEYTFGSMKGEILNNSTLSNYTWVPPYALGDEIPLTATSMECTLTVITIYNGEALGTTTTTLTLRLDPNLSGPVMTPTIEDINDVTLALTGNKSTIIKDCSVARCYANAVATTENDIITSSYIKNGQVIKDGTSAVFIAPTSAEFEFYAETKRGLAVRKIQRPVTFINYVSPTCRQKITTEISGEDSTNATVTLLITGNYYNGSFGVEYNELKIEVQHTQNDGTMGEWVDLTDGLVPIIEGNTYSLEVTITGLRHDLAYSFKSRATDKLKSASSDDYVASVLPVFDWSAEDFNFNVPIYMNEQAVLRHNAEANNTVLSASGGFIYFRQGGTNSTATEVKITPQGNIELNGDIIINGKSIKSLLGIT